MVGSLERFLIVWHALRLLCVRSFDVTISSHIPASMVVLPNGLLEYCFCLLHRNSVIPPIDQGSTVICIVLAYVFWMSPSTLLWGDVNIFDKVFEFCLVSIPVCFLQVEAFSKFAGCANVTGFTRTQIGRCCVCGIGYVADFSHMSAMLDDAKIMSGLYPFFHLALLIDFGSFALWICVKLHEFPHCSTAFPSLFVVAYPHVVWLLKSTITM